MNTFSRKAISIRCRYFVNSALFRISIISVINPGIIAIVGDISLKENLSVIKEKIGKVIPAVHCPEIIYLDEPFAYARKGLMELGLKKMEDE